MTRENLATLIADAINAQLNNQGIGAAAIGEFIELSRSDNDTNEIPLHANASNADNDNNTIPEITIVTPDQIGNFNDNNIAPPGNDHILTISYSGVIAPITIDISGTNDTPELDHADSNGDIIEDDHSHQHTTAETIKATRMTGLYEENDVIRTLINNHAIVYTIEAEDISQYGDGTGGAGTARYKSMSPRSLQIQSIILIYIIKVCWETFMLKR